MSKRRLTFHNRLGKQIQSAIGAGLFVALFAAIGYHLLHPSSAATVAPSSPPIQACSGSSTYTNPTNPTSAPAGAVTVAAGNNSSVNFSQQNTTYWFAPGVHTLGTGQFSAINVGKNSTYIGGAGAILDGQNSNDYAFEGDGTNGGGVTIKYLEIRNFIPGGDQGGINTNSDSGWTISNNYIHDFVPGGAMMVGSNANIQFNCITHNGQYAFNAYEDPANPTASTETHGPKNVTISNNELSYNNTCNWDLFPNFPITPPAQCQGANRQDGCGCDGGGKFWATDQATYTDNYVHDNYSIGLWADTNNTGFDVEGNYFSNNIGEAIIYEISYNALFKNNTFIGNANFAGPLNPGFPTPAIYISESGGESRVPGFSTGSLQITGNVFTDNFSGVALWENSDRYCSSAANTSTGDCTLVNPSVANLTTCANANLLKTTPYINDCRWKTQNVSVDHNVFNLTTANIGSKCTTNNTCGFNALFSQYGSFAPYTGWYVTPRISNTQNNVFDYNTYNGPWQFMGLSQSNEVSWTSWHAGFNAVDGAGSFNAQDIHSTFNGSTPDSTPPSTPSGVTATALTSTSVRVSWSASTDTGGSGLAGYYIYRGGVQVGSVGSTTTQYTDSTVSANTQYSYTVKAYDGAANLSAASSVATVTTPSGGAQTPSVSFAALPDNSSIHGNTYSIDANSTAVTGNTISQVQLLVDNTVIQTDTTSPYSFTLNTLSYTNGSHIIAVKATDNQGNIGTASVTVKLTNGDINSDSKVGISDLSIMASNWNKQSGATYNQGDLNTDSKVTVADLSILANRWNSQW